jgi:hypothetical protein
MGDIRTLSAAVTVVVSVTLLVLSALRAAERLRPRYFSLVVFVPATHAASVRAALAASGAGRAGAYDSCSFSSVGVGRFRPLEGARPFIGSRGTVEEVSEERLETEVDERVLGDVVRAVRDAHPYEAPAIHVTGPLLML